MTITYEDTTYEVNDEYSLKDYTGVPYLSLQSGDKVYASNFSQENPDTHIFPDNLTGATFIKCNLMNVFIPEGNTVIACRQDKFKKFNDLRDWFIDGDGNPVQVLNEKYWQSRGYSVDPDDIPDEPFTDIEQIPHN